MKRAEKIFLNALNIAKENNDLKWLHRIADNIRYPKRLKLQIIEVAANHGYLWKLDDSKLYNKHTKRSFTCNNIIKQ